jgi:sortase A
MSYLYVKKTPSLKPVKPHSTFRAAKSKKKYVATVFFGLGFFLFASAILPIVQFQLEYSIKFNQIINPLSAQFYNQGGGILGDVSDDYTQLSNWFVAEASPPKEVNFISPGNTITSYKLSIPILKVSDAVVEVGGNDLKKSLIQYAQTALPGQLGNAVVFGHSVLPQFFNPKSYMTIFSTLFKLNQGDEIIIDFDNVRYKYLVEEMYEVQPTDLSVLEQRFDGRYLTMITCSPPGTYLRRLVVKARIVDF